MSEPTRHVFRVRTMHCADCAALIDDTLRTLPGVRDARATLKTRDVSVELDPRQTGTDVVVAALTELGFQVTPPAPPPAPVTDPVEQQVSDAAWQVLEPLLRVPASGHTTRIRSHREVFEGIAYKYRHGVPWREVPAAFGPWQTLHARLARWHTDGTWAQVVTAVRRAGLADELAWVRAAGRTGAPGRSAGT